MQQRIEITAEWKKKLNILRCPFILPYLSRLSRKCKDTCMGKQHNKVQKRRRREAYNKRKKALAKAAKSK